MIKRYRYSDWPEEIARIKARIPLFSALPDGVVELIWSDFSSAAYSAQFLIVTPEYLDVFDEWLEE